MTKRRNPRETWLAFHRWIGLGAGAVLALIGLTGALLVFEPEIGALVTPLPSPTEGAVSFSAIETGLNDRLGKGTVIKVSRSAPRSTLFIASYDARDGTRLQIIDGTTGDLLEERSESRFWPMLLDLHASLLAGRTGYALLFMLGLILCGSVFTGIFLWWPRPSVWRQAFKVKWQAPVIRRLRDLHSVIAIYPALGTTIAAASGCLLLFPVLLYLFLDIDLTSRRAIVLNAPVALEKRIGLSRIVELAVRAVPESSVQDVIWPATATVPYRVFLAIHGKDSELTQVRLDLHPATGSVLRRVDGRDAFGQRLATNVALATHNGRIAGLPGRLLIFLSGLSLPGLFVTGILFWLRKRRRPVTNQARQAGAF